MNFLETWVLNFEYKFNRKVHSFDCNFMQIKKEYSYLSWMKYSENYRMKIKDHYRKWIKSLLENFDSYLELHEVIKLINDIFSKESNLEFNRKLEKFRYLLKLINIEFNKCSKINCNCDCSCIKKN